MLSRVEGRWSGGVVEQSVSRFNHVTVSLLKRWSGQITRPREQLGATTSQVILTFAALLPVGVPVQKRSAKDMTREGGDGMGNGIGATLMIDNDAC
jgi:hypothetical protein